MCDPKAHDVRIKNLEQEMAEVRKILLVGNGHKPMTERVAGLEQALATQTWLLRVILGAVITSLIGQFGPMLLGMFGG